MIITLKYLLSWFLNFPCYRGCKCKQIIENEKGFQKKYSSMADNIKCPEISFRAFYYLRWLN